jgi:hypothetical protein
LPRQRHSTAVLLLLFLIVGASREASAASIGLGNRIDVTPDLFVVPVTITDGIDVTAWAFDLRYDPLDVQVNLACDPFSGDAYCSLFTGPVTEGDFFATGSPFNVLNRRARFHDAGADGPVVRRQRRLRRVSTRCVG